MVASSTIDDISNIEAALQQGLRSGASRSLQGHTGIFVRPQSQEAMSENVSQLRKKAGAITSRKRIADLTQQLGVYSGRAGHEISANQVSFLNSPSSHEKLAEERLQKVGLHIQYSKEEGQEQDTENEQQTGSITLQHAGDQVPVSDADSRVIVESLRDMQVEVIDKSEKGHQYFVLGLNGNGEPQTQEQRHSVKKQRKACGFKTRFSDYTKNVLEHAYEFNAEGSSGRKHLEAGIVKKLSDKCGISHEQVKQWVRNKNKKVRRRYHMLETELDLRAEKESADVTYNFGRVREDSLRPSFTLNQ